MLCKLHYTLPWQREFGPPVTTTVKKYTKKPNAHAKLLFCYLNLLLFSRFHCRHCRRCLMLGSQNFHTMLTWRHTSPLYKGCLSCLLQIKCDNALPLSTLLKRVWFSVVCCLREDYMRYRLNNRRHKHNKVLTWDLNNGRKISLMIDSWQVTESNWRNVL